MLPRARMVSKKRCAGDNLMLKGASGWGFMGGQARPDDHHRLPVLLPL